jgi:hypothetical protein
MARVMADGSPVMTVGKKRVTPVDSRASIDRSMSSSAAIGEL